MMYTRAGDSSLYFTNPALEKQAFGVYLTGQDLPQQLTDADTWDHFVALFFFLGEEATSDDFPNLGQKLSDYLTAHPITHSSCLWTDDFKKLTVAPLPQTDRYAHCIFETCTCKLNAADPCFELPEETAVLLAVRKDPDTGATTIRDTATAAIGNYGISLISGATISLNSEGLNFACPPFSGQGITVPLSGEFAGVFQSGACIHDFTPYSKTGMNIGLRYNTESENDLKSQYYPIFAQGETQQYVFQMQWDILRPLDYARSWLKFTRVSFKIGTDPEHPDVFQIVEDSNAGILSSYFKTIYGKDILFRITPSSRLVFQEYLDTAAQDLNYYLAPAGDFELYIGGEGGKRHKLLCGLSGTECIEFAAGDEHTPGDLITFYPGKPSYTAAYPIYNAPDVTELLEARSTTSWAILKPQDEENPPVYFAAPEASNLFAPGSTTILDTFFAPAAVFTKAVAAANSYFFPMVPYSGITRGWPMDFDATDIAPFEKQIINPVRRDIIAKIPMSLQLTAQRRMVSDTDNVSVTAQGFLATTSGLNWRQILLASCGDGKQFSFAAADGEETIPAPLKNAFQTDDMFVVISNNDNLGIFNNALTIENWEFDVKIPVQSTNPDSDFNLQNVLLLKFRKGALTELVADVNYWTSPTAFNLNDQLQKNKIQNTISDYFNKATYMSGTDKAFENFVTLINDPDWFGVLALNVDINLGKLPNDLKALLGAMDINKFRAHHIGIEMSFISGVSNGAISTEKTKLFGMVNYIDPGYAETTRTTDFSTKPGMLRLTGSASASDAVYGYKVMKLQVSFLNSAVSNFDSLLQFTARKWFGDQASLNKPSDTGTVPGNTIQLRGHYENHDGHPTYTFLTEKDMQYKYYAKGSVIDCIDFVKVQFSTAIPDTDAKVEQNTEHITGLFSFNGYLNFRNLPWGDASLDLFSFGGAPQASAGLYFSKLAVDINFDLSNNNNTYEVASLQLNFNPLPAIFDPSMRTTRNGSFASNFPLSPISILAGNQPQQIAERNYDPIHLPRTFFPGSITGEWYGLNMDLLWGGPGALADAVGFIPKILLAWCPGEKLNTGVYIQLPGSGSGLKDLSLQGVIGLRIKNFELVIADTSYTLMLNGIKLNILSLGLPPLGSMNLALLGNETGSTGWYGMYKNQI